MKKHELKKVIKPLIKECINEILIEEGLLANVVTEVTKGLQAAPMVESAQQPVYDQSPPPQRKQQLKEQKQALLDAIGKDAYNGVNIFEDTTPFTSREVATPKAGAVDLGEPGDPGVDIGSIMGGAAKMWKAMK
tara:strand:+ start:1585 stop:1986 length:402 start_codon:yes stop_codon:yes gene_type:complete